MKAISFLLATVLFVGIQTGSAQIAPYGLEKPSPAVMGAGAALHLPRLVAGSSNAGDLLGALPAPP